MLTTIGFAFLAGVFSTLSPCVLPLVPLVLGAAISEHRFGPVALAAGLALSFTAIGLFIATIGFAAGIDADAFRNFGAILTMLIGVVLIVPRFQAQFSLASGPVANWAEHRFGESSTNGLSGQFAVGMLLGVVWSPCVGPTLGAASIMAASGENLLQVATTMILFGVGAAVPLLVLGVLSRETMIRVRGRLMATGQTSKMVMGAILMIVGALIMTGYDKFLETVIVDNSPAWLTELTTQF